jgi:hypothetical protein
MDSLKYLISFFIKIAFAFFVFAFIWWLVSLVVPDLNFRTLIPTKSGTSTSTSASEGWLPSPRAYSGLLQRKAVEPGVTTNLYVAPPPFNGYDLGVTGNNPAAYGYIAYATSPTTISSSSASSGNGRSGQLPTASSNALVNNRVLSVRNLSIYEGGHVYTGLAFIGEAKSTMFKDGKFPIVVVDQAGKVVGISAALAMTTWTVPGWVRFETKIIYPLPRDVPCTMVFEEALTQGERATRQPLRVPLPIRCN